MSRNLIGNASKYTPDAGEICVRLDVLTRTANGEVVAPDYIPVDTLPAPSQLVEVVYVIGQVMDTGYGITAIDKKAEVALSSFNATSAFLCFLS